MGYNEFLNIIIDTGIEAAKKDYTKPEDKDRLEGSIAGFEACRNKTPEELPEIYSTAGEYAHKEAMAYMNYKVGCKDKSKEETILAYRYFRCYQAEVEWVCNVISAMLINQNKPPIFSHLPTTRGMMRAIQIINNETA